MIRNNISKMDATKTLIDLIGSVNYTRIFFIFAFTFLFYYRKNIHIIYKTFPRDMDFLCRALKSLWSLSKILLRGETIVSLFQKQALNNPDKIIFYYQDTTWTVKELDVYSNKVARIFHKRGYKKGDVVALICYNKPEFVGIWLGLGKLGVVTALINTNLKSQSLAHCINIGKCKGFIISSEFSKDVNKIRDSLSPDLEYISFGESSELENVSFKLNEMLKVTDGSAIVPDMPIQITDKLLYIYTSGTTGLPKAAIMTHKRVLYITVGLTNFMKLVPEDIVYNPLPMYHTSGGALSIMPCLTIGLSVVVRTKFSASNYFPDCIKYKCTVGQYIGEMCRYLLAVPPSENDTKHSLRMVMGNGVKSDVWKLFVERFKIPLLMELYGSTEGNSNIANIDNTIGAVGFKPSFLPMWLYPVNLIKYDEISEEPVRDKNGFCIRCGPNEPGMCIGIIKDDSVRNFDGYVDQKETSKKLIHNVFKKGDSAFLTGDVLYMDELGYFYFKDRTGDTFRWKGENVSTIEVEMVIQKLINFKDCTVYGVEVGNLEGRAGMVAIADPKNEIDLDALAKGLDKNLPSYARPLFLRIIPEIKLTGTYKVIKTELKKEGFNVNVVKDKLYFKDSTRGFVPITQSLYNDIITGSGAVKL